MYYTDTERGGYFFKTGSRLSFKFYVGDEVRHGGDYYVWTIRDISPNNGSHGEIYLTREATNEEEIYNTGLKKTHRIMTLAELSELGIMKVKESRVDTDPNKRFKLMKRGML